MATYRYILYDILTNTPLLELPFYGTWFSKQLNKTVNGTASMQLDADGFHNADIIDSTIPGRTKLYVERNGKIVWGGIIWTRTWQEQAKQFNFTLQCFKSWAYATFIEATLQYSSVDQRNILIDLFDKMQAKPYTNFGIELPPDFATDASSILRTVDFFDYDGWTFGRAIEHLIAYDKGFDYDIVSTWGPTGFPVDTLIVDNVLGKSLGDDSPSFDYPGNIKNFWYPESASRSGVSVIGFGKGEGASMTRSKYVNPGYLGLGFPDIQIGYDNKDVSDQVTLDSQTQAYAVAHKPPVISPTIEINPEMEPFFESWDLGDWGEVLISSKRFPGGYALPVRIIGWELNPPQKGQTEETLKLALAEVED